MSEILLCLGGILLIAIGLYVFRNWEEPSGMTCLPPDRNNHREVWLVLFNGMMFFAFVIGLGVLVRWLNS